MSRRQFMVRSVGALMMLGAGERALSAHASAGSADGLRIDLETRVLNGQDFQVARFLEDVVAREHTHYAALIRAGAAMVQAMAGALAPSGAVETWRLDDLARRRVSLLSAEDDSEVRRDLEAGDRRFREALRVMLPGTEFFRLYLGHIGEQAARLDRPARTRLARMADTSLLSGDEVDFLLGLEGSERIALAIQPLAAFRRFTDYRYLGVWRRFRSDGPDILVPAVGAFDAGLGGAAPTSLADQVGATAGMVTLFGGRLLPLAPFDPATEADAGDCLALVADAIQHRGFVGVRLASPDGGLVPPRALDALMSWCAREEVAVVLGPGPWSDRRPASFLGLHRGQRTRERLERFYVRQNMARPDWMRRLDEADIEV